MIDFEKITGIFNAAQELNESILNEKYLYKCIVSTLPLHHIDFDKFNIVDAIYVFHTHDEQFEHIEDEDEDEEYVAISNNSPLSRIPNIRESFFMLGDLPKQTKQSRIFL